MSSPIRTSTDAALLQVFIEEFLKHHGVRGLFGKGISTNGGVFTEDGRLDVQPYHTDREEPHGCSLCPPNMCKGESKAFEDGMEKPCAEVQGTTIWGHWVSRLAGAFVP